MRFWSCDKYQLDRVLLRAHLLDLIYTLVTVPFLPQHVFTMNPLNVESGRGKVPHDPSFPFTSTFSGKSQFIFHMCLSPYYFVYGMLTVSVDHMGCDI